MALPCTIPDTHTHTRWGRTVRQIRYWHLTGEKNTAVKITSLRKWTAFKKNRGWTRYKTVVIKEVKTESDWKNCVSHHQVEGPWEKKKREIWVITSTEVHGFREQERKHTKAHEKVQKRVLLSHARTHARTQPGWIYYRTMKLGFLHIGTHQLARCRLKPVSDWLEQFLLAGGKQSKWMKVQINTAETVR